MKHRPLAKRWQTGARVALFCLCASVAGAQENTSGQLIQNFYLQLDAASRKPDPVAFLDLVVSLEGKSLWSFGGGEGPTDVQALRLRAFMIGAGSFFDATGNLHPSIMASAGKRADGTWQQWVKQLAVKPGDAKAMKALFASADPSVRWIGIYKSRFTKDRSAVLDELKRIAAHDDYVIVANRPVPPSGGPPRMHDEVTDFVAPLRGLAREQLSRWGQEPPADDGKIAAFGWKMLFRSYREHESWRRLLTDHVGILPPGSGLPVSFQRMTPDPEDQVAADAFRKALKLP